MSRTLFFSALLSLSTLAAWAQTNKQQADDYLRLAEEMMNASQADNDIREVLVLAANADTTNVKANFEAGQYYIRTVGKDLALRYLLRAYHAQPDYRFDLEYWIAKSYQYGLDFDHATEYFNRYENHLKQNPGYSGKDKVDLQTVEKSLTECEVGKEFMANPGDYSITNLGRDINSEWDDYGPVLNEAEDELIFTTRRKDGNLNDDVFEDNIPYEDIFISHKVNGKWEPARNIGVSVNTKFQDSALGLSADGNTLFIFKDSNGGDIYYCRRVSGDHWGEARPLEGLINSPNTENSISISTDENVVFFTSNRPGGFGGLDIYMATKDNKGQWSNIKNLGPHINTAEDEDGPFLGYDNKTLFFSSKGWKNMGGFDIFKSTYDSATNEWSLPENLGYPINTPDNDIYYVSTASGHAYYSSVREDAMGYDDIYMISKTEPKKLPEAAKLVPLEYDVKVVDEDGNPITAHVRLQRLPDNVEVNGTQSQNGTYAFFITAADASDYKLSIEKEGYAFQNIVVHLDGASSTGKTQAFDKTIQLKKLNVGLVAVLRNIYFDIDKATFRTESYDELNKLDRMMEQNPAIKVEISGHTDNSGPADYNMRLSQKRAEAVKDFLLSKGIDARRITAVGYGETRPLVSNDDETGGREINRRVEFKVTGNH